MLGNSAARVRIFASDVFTGLAIFAALVGLGAAWCFWPQLSAHFAEARDRYAIGAIGAFAVVAAMLPRYFWPAYHAIANTFWVDEPRPLRKVYAIDGDTIMDCVSATRYRLANIDAPETGERARCFTERWAGESAKQFASTLIADAEIVAVRKTWRIDPYGRVVAFVLVDGQDLGQILVREGLARPWHGRRKRWCGPKGGIALMARQRNMASTCRPCGPRAWRKR